MNDFSLWLQSNHTLDSLDEKAFDEKEESIIEFLGGIKNMIQICMNSEDMTYLQQKELHQIALKHKYAEEIANRFNLISLPQGATAIIYNFLNKSDHCSLMRTCTELLYIGRLPMSVKHQLNLKKKFIGNSMDNQSIEWIINDNKSKNLKGIKHLITKYHAEIDKFNYKPIFDAKLIPYILRNCNGKYLNTNKQYKLAISSMKLLSMVFRICSFDEFLPYLVSNNMFNIWKTVFEFTQFAVNNNDVKLYDIIILFLNILLCIDICKSRYYKKKDQKLRDKQSVAKLIKKEDTTFIIETIEFIIKYLKKCNYATNIQFICCSLAILENFISINPEKLSDEIIANLNYICVKLIKYLSKYFDGNWRNMLNVGDEIFSQNDVAEFEKDNTDTYKRIKSYGLSVYKLSGDNITFKDQERFLTQSRSDNDLIKLHDKWTSAVFYNTLLILLRLKNNYNIDISFEKLSILKDIIKVIEVSYFFGMTRNEWRDKDIQSMAIKTDHRILNEIITSKHKKVIFKNCIDIIVKEIIRNDIKPNMFDIIDMLFDDCGNYGSSMLSLFNTNSNIKKEIVMKILYHLTKCVDVNWENMNDTMCEKVICWALGQLIHPSTYKGDYSVAESVNLVHFDALNGFKVIDNILNHILKTLEWDQNKTLTNIICSCVRTLVYVTETNQNNSIINKCYDILEKYIILLDIHSGFHVLSKKHNITKCLHLVVENKPRLIIDIIKVSDYDDTKVNDMRGWNLRNYMTLHLKESFIHCLLNVAFYGDYNIRELLIENTFLWSLYSYWSNQPTDIELDTNDNKIITNFWEHHLKIFEIAFLKEFSIHIVCKNVSKGLWIKILTNINLEIAKFIVSKYFGGS